MEVLKQKKDKLRKDISSLKLQFTERELLEKSEEVFSVVELTGVFQDAKRIFIYYSLPGEVSTLNFIEKWKEEKEFFLPVVQGDTLTFRKYISGAELNKSAFGVLEPQGEDFLEYKKVDLIIVPGVSFDRRKNRIGYGKGYYDRFLSSVNIPKMGVCYDFQLLDNIPTDENDIQMDYVISENDLIW